MTISANPRKLAKIMKALSHEKRLSLYLDIAEKQEAGFRDDACHISEVTALLGLSAPTISHHLKELVNADLITTQKEGKYLTARINEETLKEVQELFSALLR